MPRRKAQMRVDPEWVRELRDMLWDKMKPYWDASIRRYGRAPPGWRFGPGTIEETWPSRPARLNLRVPRKRTRARARRRS